MLRIHKSKKFFENDVLSSYDGREDTDMSVWFNERFLKDKFDEFNRRFFSNRLPKIPVEIKGISGKKLGCCCYVTPNEQVEALNTAAKDEIKAKNVRNKLVAQSIVRRLLIDMKIEQHVSRIQITDGKWSNRFFLEGTLLHEMCHAYQLEILCDGLLAKMNADNSTGQGSTGHGLKFFEAAKLVNDSPENREGFKITQYGAEGEMTRKAYKSADGYLSIECLNNVLIKATFVSKSNVRQALMDMPNNTYFFSFKDGDVKATFKPSGKRIALLTEDYTRKVEDAIKRGDLVLYAVNRKGVFNSYVLKKGEAENISDYMEIYDVMDCENIGFQCYRSQVADLFNGNGQIFAQRIADTLKQRFNIYGAKHYLYAAPETFESMFTVGDDSLVPVVSDTIQNVKSNNRKSLDELLKLNNARLEGLNRIRNSRRRYESMAEDNQISDMVDDVLFEIIGNGTDDITLDRNGDIMVKQECRLSD